jgi:putative DNA-invertase from lambdoid prophage Rac
MGATLAYCRVSTNDQSAEAQRHAIGERYKIEVDHWLDDEGVSKSVKALQCPGFAGLFKFARKGDAVIVAVIERLGREAVEVLESVEALKRKGVTVISMREGFDLGMPFGKCMLTILTAGGLTGTLRYQEAADSRYRARQG